MSDDLFCATLPKFIELRLQILTNRLMLARSYLCPLIKFTDQHLLVLPGSSPSSLSSSSDSSPSSYWADRSNESERVEPEYEPTPPTKRRRNCTSFSAYQIRQLKRAFAVSMYLSYAMEDDLIRHLGLTGKQIRVS